MTISYPLTLPTSPGLKRVSWQMDNAVSMKMSPYTFATQVQQYSGQQWKATCTLPIMSRAKAEVWQAFLASLMGDYGTFYLGDPLAKSPQGTGAGTPKVNGGSQTGNVLNTKGWMASVTVLKAGDFIQIGTRLHKTLTDTVADGSGNASLDIWPRIRESPADNDTVTLTNTVGLFRLAGPSTPLYDSDTDRLYVMSFAAVEAL